MKNDGSNVEKYSALSVIHDEEDGSLFSNVASCTPDSNILYRVVLVF